MFMDNIKISEIRYISPKMKNLQLNPLFQKASKPHKIKIDYFALNF